MDGLLFSYRRDAVEEAKGESSNQYTRANKKVNKKKKNPPKKTRGKVRRSKPNLMRKTPSHSKISRLFTRKPSRSFTRKQNLSSKRSG